MSGLPIKLNTILFDPVYQHLTPKCKNDICPKLHVDKFIDIINHLWPGLEGKDAEIKFHLHRLTSFRLVTQSSKIAASSSCEEYEHLAKSLNRMIDTIDSDTIEKLTNEFAASNPTATIADCAKVSSLIIESSVKDKREKMTADKVKRICSIVLPESSLTLRQFAVPPNPKVAKAIQDEIEVRIKRIEAISALNPDGNLLCRKLVSSTYDAYAIVGDPPTPSLLELPVFTSGSDSKARSHTAQAALGAYDYMLSVTPSNVYQLGDLISIAVKDGIRLLVTCYEEGEKKCLDYWKDEILREAPLRHGLSYLRSTVDNVFTDPKSKSKSVIVERTFHFARIVPSTTPSTTPSTASSATPSATSSTQPVAGGMDTNRQSTAGGTGEALPRVEYINITHLHFAHWPDAKIHPNAKVFEMGLNRIDELTGGGGGGQSSKFQLGCKHCHGRSGVLLTCHQLRTQIRKKLAMGESLEEIKLNVPDTVYKIRLQRHKFLTNKHQLATVYQYTYSYYLRLKAVKDGLNLAFASSSPEDRSKLSKMILSYL